MAVRTGSTGNNVGPNKLIVDIHQDKGVKPLVVNLLTPCLSWRSDGDVFPVYGTKNMR